MSELSVEYAELLLAFGRVLLMTEWLSCTVFLGRLLTLLLLCLVLREMCVLWQQHCFGLRE
jgi:hypothetical protein